MAKFPLHNAVEGMKNIMVLIRKKHFIISQVNLVSGKHYQIKPNTNTAIAHMHVP